MAYRRRQVNPKGSAFREEIYQPPVDENTNSSSTLAAQAIRASAAHRESSHSSAYADSSSFNDISRDSSNYDCTSGKSPESKGFWGVLARKAKAILDEDDMYQPDETHTKKKSDIHIPNASTGGQYYQPYQSPENSRKMENPTLRKGLNALTTSLNQIGDSIGNALEEGRTRVEKKSADIIQETRKLQIRRKGSAYEEQNPGVDNPWQPISGSQPQYKETQLKASRDVAMATAAKAKLLLRELKTVKADLAFAKERCAQLEEENKVLREARDNKGDYPADDDMIRLQLETLLEEKARLAHENSVFARENRFLREIVDYHQLTMQDVVYLDEGIEEMTEVYPFPAVSRMLSVSPPSPRSPGSPPPPPPQRSASLSSSSFAKEVFPVPPHQSISSASPGKQPPKRNTRSLTSSP